MWALVASWVLAQAPPLPPGMSPPRVWLDGHRGELVAKSPARLRFRALAHSRLPVPIEELEVGVLFAKSEAALKSADPARLYQPAAKAGKAGAVGAVRQWVSVRLTDGGQQAILVDAPLLHGDPEPVHWVAHLLGYRLAEVDVDLFVELLRSEASVDEVAVVETLALCGPPARKRAVRQRWGGRAALIGKLIERAQGDVPTEPTYQDALLRIFAVRALGVLGGDRVLAALQGLLRSAKLDPLNESLMVISIARLRGSPLETPLAYAVPPTARTMHDVVAAALEDATDLDGSRADPLPANGHPAPSGSPLSTGAGHGISGETLAGALEPGAPVADFQNSHDEVPGGSRPASEPSGGSQHESMAALAGLAVVVLLLVAAVMVIRSRRR